MEFSHLHFIIHTWDFSAVTCLQRQRPTENRHFPSIHYYDLSSQYIKVGPVFSWCIILEQNSSNTKKKSLHDNKISLLTSLHSLVPQCLVQLMVPVTSHKVLPVWEWAATVAVESHIDYTSLTQFPACLCLCVCLFVSIFWARPKKGITAHMTYISACTCPHKHTDVGATPAHERTHTNLRTHALCYSQGSHNIRRALVWFCEKLCGSCLDILIEGKSHYRLAVGKKYD